MVQTGREIDLCVCKGCEYYRRLGSDMACHYAIDTNDVRGMTPSECYKQPGTPYKPVSRGKKREKRKFTVKSNKKEKEEMAKHSVYSRETKEAAVKAVLVDKEPSEVVRERYCIAKSTLGKWVTEAKREQAKYFAYADSIHLKNATGQDRTGQDRTGQRPDAAVSNSRKGWYRRNGKRIAAGCLG